MERNIILNSTQIGHKINRMAYQIYEHHIHEEEIVLAGIEPNGLRLVELIHERLGFISDKKIKICGVKIDKNNPLKGAKLALSKEEYINKAVVLVDDVLNSGSTLIYGVKAFLDVPLRQLKTAVLIDRNHKKFPVKADFKGLSLSTSLQENVCVELSGDKFEAYLQ